VIPSSLHWGPLVSFPIEWGALALLVAGAIYWERAALSGLGIEGCLLSAVLGMALAYEATGDYAIACAAGAGAAVAFALLGSGLLLSLRADPLVGSFCLSLIPACALGLLVRSVPLRILRETPAPGLVSGTIFDGTYAEDLLASPWFLAVPVVLTVAVLVMLKTPYGLKLRGYSETPAFARRGPAAVAWVRVSAAALGALFVVPAAALMLRAHPGSLPVGLGFIALACAVAGRWGFLPALLLAGGPALLRAARPYGGESDALGLSLAAAPFLLALLYLILLTRRALRAATTSQSRLDPDVL
jgi:ABC-type uncharacterized transport system permease subunit